MNNSKIKKTPINTTWFAFICTSNKQVRTVQPFLFFFYIHVFHLGKLNINEICFQMPLRKLLKKP